MDKTKKNLSSKPSNQDNHNNMGCYGDIHNSHENKPVVTRGKLAATPAGIGECLSQMKNYLAAMKQLCGAGTHIAQAFREVLSDSALGEIAGQFLGAARELESATQNETSQLQRRVDEWTRAHDGAAVQTDGRAGSQQESGVTLDRETQNLLTCFTALMNLQCQFFTSSTEVLAPFSKYQSLEDLLSETDSGSGQSEVSQSKTSDYNPQNHAADTSKSSTTDSLGTSLKLGSQLNFFSKLPMSKSDMNKHDFFADRLSQGLDESKENKSRSNCDHLWKQSMPAVDREKPPLPPGARAINGQGHMKVNSANRIPLSSLPVLQNVPNLASEEEIDSIINFLSFSTAKPSSMQTIPENMSATRASGLRLHNAAVKPVGTLPSGGQFSHDAYDYCNNNSFYSNEQQQTHVAMGNQQLVDDSLAVRGEFNKTNTWPSKVQHRNTAAYQNMSHDLMSSQNFPAFDNLTNEAEYSRYITSVSQMLQGGGSYGNQGMNLWQRNGEDYMSTGWPLPLMASESSQDPVKNWSANQDSSSCSDESSNGDNPFSVGLDLVATMNEQSRRHSTSDDTSSISSSTLTEMRHRSLDDSQLEHKSTNTWPPKSPWTRGDTPNHFGGVKLADPVTTNQNAQHSRLAVPWSDPLAARHISPWGSSGMTPQFLGGMQNYGGLPVGGAGDVQNLDSKYKCLPSE